MIVIVNGEKVNNGKINGTGGPCPPCWNDSDDDFIEFNLEKVPFFLFFG